MNETWWRNPEDLDDDQKSIVALPLTGSHLVMGPPGSGKTNLLLLRATFLVRAGYPNIAIITFNRVLREFLVTGAGNYPFEAERIQTFRSWAMGILKNAGIEVNNKGGFEELRAQLMTALTTLSQSGVDDGKFDCILIDEAQDYFQDEIEIFIKFADEIFAVGDDNQRIYRAAGSIETLKNACSVAKPLSYHYRNGLEICRLADGIMNVTDGGMVDSCNYDESKYPSKVRKIGNKSIEDQVKAMTPDLEAQLLAYPDEWIGVLAPLKTDVTQLFEELSKTTIGKFVQLQKYDAGYESLDPDRPIIVSTMHSAKGLEFRATHLAAFDHISKLDHSQRLAYTAVTRAKTSVTIYHEGPVPGYVEKGMIAVNGAPTKAPSLSELFGDKA